MLNKFSNIVCQNKNLLMLLSASIYMLALVATLQEFLLPMSLFFLFLFIYFLIKGVFPVKYIIIWAVLFGVGVVNTSLRLKDVDELLSIAPLNSEISGTVVSIPQGSADEKFKFFFSVDKIKSGSFEKEFKDEKVLVTLDAKSKVSDLKIYNSLKMSGRLAAPFKAGNPSQFDYGIYLRNHYAYSVFYAKSYNLLANELSFKERLLQNISSYRDRIIKIHSQYLESPNLEILGGIVFGDDAVSPPKDVKNSFANSGLLHILAASGMNVAFIFGFFFWIFSRFKLNYKLNVAIGMVMVIIYSLMTGLGASIIRATVMLLFVLIGKLIDRDAHSISLLAFVALLMTVYNPLFINDVGFQLSFIVTFGILLMTPALVRFNNKILDYIIATISIPVIAQLWIIPIQIFYFSNISVYSVFANVMSVPILAVLSFGGFISALLSAISPIADFICKSFDFILNPLLSLLINISEFWGHLPNSSVQTTHPCIFQILVYYAILLCLSGIMYKEIREKFLKKLILLISFLLLVWLVTLIPIKNKNLEIIAFDVGNADCFLIKSPNNEYMMIDSGRSGYKGGKSQAEIIVLEYMKDHGIKDLKFLVVTHFDNDHCGGAVDIMKNLNVERIYVNNLNHNSLAAIKIYQTAESNDTELVSANNRQVIYDNNELKIKSLLTLNSDNDNENSIVNLLEYNDFKMLFTGDVSAAGIKEIIDDLPQNITVLKVPHHGAIDGLNKEIVNFLKPEYSLISVGENRFEHPAGYILELLKNSKVLRTDINNSILISVNKKGVKILSYDIKSQKYK